MLSAYANKTEKDNQICTVGNKKQQQTKKRVGSSIHVSHCRLSVEALHYSFPIDFLFFLIFVFVFHLSLCGSVLENFQDLTPLPSASSVAYRSVFFFTGENMKPFIALKQKANNLKFTIAYPIFFFRTM